MFLNDIVWKKGCNLEIKLIDFYWYYYNYKLKLSEYLKDLFFNGFINVKWLLLLYYD